MKSVLVANRGEIACRVIAACQRLGLRSVAIYSDADRNARHVGMADVAIRIGPPPARQSYLAVDRILLAATMAEADAIHPGYGFLSESVELAAACRDAGIRFIGPRPETIELMGDKDRAREFAIAAGVPVVPGSRRFEGGDLDGIEQEAERIGYPVMVKAVGGGGGIGMHEVAAESELREAVERSQQMALSAFSRSAVYLEKLLRPTRHIEVQLFGFGDGRVLHLYERECSLQRRFQKVVEESPSPALGDELRARMCDAAVRLASAASYENAGTVEFLLGPDGEFYFLEMNTRIQVEHGITELRTGVDLVSWQLLLANDMPESLPQRQDEIVACGASIECRIYAEDPVQRFRPSPGTLSLFRPPLGRPRTRVDAGVREGDAITFYYDPLIAKLLVEGSTREDARLRLLAALGEFEVVGVMTNIPFLRELIRSPEFIAGQTDTKTIDRFVDGRAS